MTPLAEALDELLTLKAHERAVGDAAKGVKAKAEALALDRHAEEGARTWDRPGGGVSIVQPSPRFDVVDPAALVDWLPPELVVERVEVDDPAALIEQLVDIDSWFDGDGQALDPAAWRDTRRLISIVRVPAGDWHQHVDLVTPGENDPTGRYPVATPDGETVPGVEYVIAAPSGIQVRPAKTLIERFAPTIGVE